MFSYLLHRQHDTNATIYACKVDGCSFSSLRSDKYLEHMKRYHPNPSTNTENPIPKNASAPQSSVSSEPFVIKSSTTQKIAQLNQATLITSQHPLLHQHQHLQQHPEEGIQIISVEASIPTNPMRDQMDEGSLSQFQEDERNNQSSPIPTKNVDNGGGLKPPIILSRRLNTSPVIGIINMSSSHQHIVKEDSSSSGSCNNETAAPSSSSLLSHSSSVVQLSVQKTSISNVAITDGGQVSNEIQALKLTTKIDSSGLSFDNSTQIREIATTTNVLAATSTTEGNSSHHRLAKNVFNTISPPNKTVTDALSTFSDTPPVPLEEPTMFSNNAEETLFSNDGGGTELDEVVDSVISNSNPSSMQF